MNEEMDILGFDPSQLSVFAANDNAGSASSVNKNLYTAKPADTKSEDGVYRSTIKVIYSPQNLKNSIVEVQSYTLHDDQGYFTVPTSLMIGDKSCPIFTAWKKCHFAEVGSTLWKQAAAEKDGGKALFDKRFARYVTIQVIDDKNKPELNGKYMLWKLPTSIYEMIEKKQHPAKESGKCPIPVMDFLFGYAIELEVNPGPDDPKNPQRKTREISYSGEFTDEPMPCTNPDGTSLLDEDEEEVLEKYVRAMKKVWKEKDAEKRAEMLDEVNSDPNTKSLRKIYTRVLNDIKEFCPDVNEEYKFKPWDDDTTKRVKRWIDIVLSGNSPVTTSAVPDSVKEDTPNESGPVSRAEAAEEPSGDDDLPF